MGEHRTDMSELTWPEYRDLLSDGAPVLLPVGTTEQHGPHLPLGVDWMLPQEMCRRVAAEIGGIVAPAITYGYKSHLRTGGGDRFPGSTNLSGGTLTALVHEVLSEFARHGAQRLLVLLGHGENEWFTREACDLAARDAAAAGREVQILLIGYWEVRDPGFIASIYPADEPLVPQLQHAAWTETSMMLHAFPDLVRRSEFPPDEKAMFPPYDVFPEPMDLVPASGVFSATSTATEESGRALISHTVERIIEAARTEFGL